MRRASTSRLRRVVAVLALFAAVAVPVAGAFGFDDSNHPPDGPVGQPYSYTFGVEGGCPPYNLVVRMGSLPPGLSFPASAPTTLEGTPTAAGTYSFWLEARDTGGCGGSCPPAGVSCTVPSQVLYTIGIAPRLVVTTDSLPPALVGAAYTTKLTASGGGTQVWSLASGTLPAGLTLSADGTISGTPTSPTQDPVSFAVKVADASRSDTKMLTIDVVTPLAVSQPTLPLAEVGHPLPGTPLVATGGRSPYTWALVSAPSWMTVDAASGAIGGTPSVAGSFPVQVSVKDKYGASATATVTAAVNARVAVKTTRLPLVHLRRRFRSALKATGGVGPFHWKLATGRLPVGLSLDPRTGVISGATRRQGRFRLAFAVTDALGVTATASLTLTVSR